MIKIDNEDYQPGKYYPRKGKFISCPNCGKESFGRRNQKFCDPKCRTEYHNGLRSERNNHPELEKLKAADQNLKLLHEKFGDTAIPERVLDAFGLFEDFLHILKESDQYRITCFINYGLLFRTKEESYHIIQVQKVEVLEKESFERFLDRIEKDPSLLGRMKRC